MNRLAAIHQPNFFPWLGYFDKIARSDVFIFLDDVQFPKKGGAWTNRVKLIVDTEPKWFTASINRHYRGTLNINQMTFAHGSPWRSKIANTLQTRYSNHPFYEQSMDILEPLLMNPEPNIAEYNIHAVTVLASVLGLNHVMLTRSSAYSITTASTLRLCELTRVVGANTYLCGGGAGDYQDDQLFSSHGLALEYQKFSHPVYPQHRSHSFFPGLSIIDPMMNIGLAATSKLIASRGVV